MNKAPEPLQPGSTIGILGGGQLAQMLVLAGQAMGLRFVVLEPGPGCPANCAGALQIQSAYDSPLALEELARRCDIVTYEFENVKSDSVAWLEKQIDVPQGSELLKKTQNRLQEKTALQQLQIPVAPFQSILSENDLSRSLQEFEDLMLKTVTGGYDGKGQIRVNHFSQIKDAFQKLNKNGSPLIAEKFMPFDREVSVMVARNRSGEVSCFPLTENGHENNILLISRIPARLSEKTLQNAKKLAEQIAKGLNLVGILGVEMFVMPDGEIRVNELAPRPHNSGHYTQNACSTSQFEQHLRAIMNWPLASTELLKPAVMLNILGEHYPKVLEKIHLWNDANLHLYSKKECRTGRKMGHLNFLCESPDLLLKKLLAEQIWDEKMLTQMLGN